MSNIFPSKELRDAMLQHAANAANLQRSAHELAKALNAGNDPIAHERLSADAGHLTAIAESSSSQIRQLFEKLDQPMPELEQQAAPDKAKWTALVVDATGGGTTYITRVEGSRDEAIDTALERCRNAWGYQSTYQLRLLGLLHGEPEIAEWDDGE